MDFIRMLLGPENQSGPQQHFLQTLQKHISFHLLLPEILFPPLRAERENASFMTSTIPSENTETHTLYNTYYTPPPPHTHTEASHTPHKHRPYHTRKHLPGPQPVRGWWGGSKTVLITANADVLNRTSKTHTNLMSLQYQFFLSTI